MNINIVGNHIGNYYYRLDYYDKNVKFIIKISDFDKHLWEYIANDIKINCQMGSNKKELIELSITDDGFIIFLIVNNPDDNNIITIYIALDLSSDKSILHIINKPNHSELCAWVRIFGVTGGGFQLDSPRRYYDDEEDDYDVDNYDWTQFNNHNS